MARSFGLRLNNTGFTLLEALLSLSIIGILTGISLPLYSSMQRRGDIHTTVQASVDKLRLAQVYARDGYHDDTWSVRFANSVATLYKGSDYTTRDSNYDEVFSIPATMSGPVSAEVHFQKNTGFPAAPSEIIFNKDGTNHPITVNDKGAIFY